MEGEEGAAQMLCVCACLCGVFCAFTLFCSCVSDRQNIFISVAVFHRGKEMKCW